MKRSLVCHLFAVLVLAACGQNENPTQSANPAMQFVIPAEAREMSIDAIKGEWQVGPRVAIVKIEGNSIACINEKGDPSKCEIKNGKVLLASDWRVYATLIADGKVLRWSDGSGWTR